MPASETQRMRWRRSDRIRHARDFQAGLRRRPKRGKHLMLFISPSRAGRSRLGLIVGRKVGKAVARNRVRRIIRETFRTQRHQLPKPVDVLVRALPGSADVEGAALRRELCQLLGVLEPNALPGQSSTDVSKEFTARGAPPPPAEADAE